ncbi:hypothetical protein Ddye_002939 [Dipteronia dyeriana]|uniref:Uncharacterized protein n=1 Tax=Dipteronia dyeriana TaxID=168575 RepID=A0AAD9XRS0_9ROSI|nr:hypothetical protein Ddye_002939 [Dipteronia dyeriana]
MSGSTNLVSVNFSDSDLEEGKKPLFVEEDTCAELVRYYSTKSGDEMTSLKDYVTRMKEGQKDIYYITGKSKKAVENSPSLERLKKKDYEVLLVVVTVDGYGISQLKEYDGKKLVSATKEGLKLDEDEDESEDRSDIVEEDDGEDTFMHALNNELKNTTLKESFVHANEESSKKIEGASNATDLDMEEPAFHLCSPLLICCFNSRVKRKKRRKWRKRRKMRRTDGRIVLFWGARQIPFSPNHHLYMSSVCFLSYLCIALCILSR